MSVANVALHDIIVTSSRRYAGSDVVYNSRIERAEGSWGDGKPLGDTDFFLFKARLSVLARIDRQNRRV